VAQALRLPAMLVDLELFLLLPHRVQFQLLDWAVEALRRPVSATPVQEAMRVQLPVGLAAVLVWLVPRKLVLPEALV
jgi:hypothetical protein